MCFAAISVVSIYSLTNVVCFLRYTIIKNNKPIVLLNYFINAFTFIYLVNASLNPYDILLIPIPSINHNVYNTLLSSNMLVIRSIEYTN